MSKATTSTTKRAESGNITTSTTTGREANTSGEFNVNGNMIPIADIPIMSDEKWRELSEKQATATTDSTNREYTTTSGYTVTRFTTRELAELVLAMPDTMFSFVTTPSDMFRHAELNIDQPINPYPWYGIVCTRLFDVYSVFVNRSTLFGGAPFMFDLPDYDSDIDAGFGEEQSEECMQDMIDGLNRFNELHGIEPDTWYFKESEQDNITILFNGRE